MSLGGPTQTTVQSQPEYALPYVSDLFRMAQQNARIHRIHRLLTTVSLKPRPCSNKAHRWLASKLPLPAS